MKYSLNPWEIPQVSALGISLGLRLYFTVYRSSRHNTDTICQAMSIGEEDWQSGVSQAVKKAKPVLHKLTFCIKLMMLQLRHQTDNIVSHGEEKFFRWMFLQGLI